jgi:hypothetical protein
MQVAFYPRLQPVVGLALCPNAFDESKSAANLPKQRVLSLFSFSTTFGNDSIANFTTGRDGINLDHTEFADFAAVQSHAQQVGNDTVINYDANSSITTLSTLVSNLHASDFHFV